MSYSWRGNAKWRNGKAFAAPRTNKQQPLGFFFNKLQQHNNKSSVLDRDDTNGLQFICVYAVLSSWFYGLLFWIVLSFIMMFVVFLVVVQHLRCTCYFESGIWCNPHTSPRPGMVRPPLGVPSVPGVVWELSKLYGDSWMRSWNNWNFEVFLLPKNTLDFTKK